MAVRVSHQAHRDVILYSDKETNLLVKTQTRSKDDGFEEETVETFLSGYKQYRQVD